MTASQGWLLRHLRYSLMEEHTQAVSNVLVRILLSHSYASGVIVNTVYNTDISSNLIPMRNEIKFRSVGLNLAGLG